MDVPDARIKLPWQQRWFEVTRRKKKKKGLMQTKKRLENMYGAPEKEGYEATAYSQGEEVK